SNASRTPVHGCGFSGGRNRRAPAVDAPYGTPRNAWIFLSISSPRTLPALVATICPGVPAGACAQPLRQSRIRPAPAAVLVAMKRRRFIRPLFPYARGAPPPRACHRSLTLAALNRGDLPLSEQGALRGELYQRVTSRIM